MNGLFRCSYIYIAPISQFCSFSLQPDSSFDRALDKVFHPDKFDVSQLNLAPVGEVDERARHYHRARTTTGAY